MTQNFAHRGFCARYPENTMLAFEKALQAGCDGIELDVHLTKDGQIVIIHDEEVNRTTDGRGFVKDMTLTEIKALDAGNGQRVPTFEEYLDLVEKLDIITNIELKNSIIRYEGMERMVIDAVRRRGMEKKIILSSFNHVAMCECGEIAPDIARGFLTCSWLIDAGAYSKKHGMTSYHPDYNSLTDEAVAEIHGHGIAINAYTVNDRAAMRRLAEIGINGVITDNPALMSEVLAELGGKQ